MAKLRSDGVQCKALLGALAGRQYDRTAGESCLKQIRAASSKPGFCGSTSDPGAGACDNVLASTNGTAKPGELCTKTEDCAASPEGRVTCQSLFLQGAQIRKCQVQKTGKEGDMPCAGTVDGSVTSFSSSGQQTDIAPTAYLCRVSDGLYCDGQSLKCTKIQAVGAACSTASSSYACVKEAYCDSVTRVCNTRKPAGSACTADRECVAGTYCDSMTRMCKASLAAGAACTSSRECASSSCVNMKCADTSAAGNLGLALICGT
jgi:hypothetical protein